MKRVLEAGNGQPKTVMPYQVEGAATASTLKKLQRMKRRDDKRFRSYDKDGNRLPERRNVG